VICQQLTHDFNALIGSNIRQTDNPGMRSSFSKDQPAEIGIDGDENAPLRGRNFEQFPIPWIRPKIACVQRIVLYVRQPCGHASTRAAIDTKPHGVTST
jgi:hypothetical protein